MWGLRGALLARSPLMPTLSHLEIYLYPAWRNGALENVR